MITLHPDAAKKAQEEIDEVIGSGRLPAFDDRSQLPYIDCILKEVHRWVKDKMMHMPAVLTSPIQHQSARSCW